MIKYSFLSEKYLPSESDLEAINSLSAQRHPGLPKVVKKQVMEMVKNSYSVVARDSVGDQIVGMAMLGVFVRLEGKKGFVEDVVVDEKYRDRGIGRKLMEMLTKKAKNLKIKQLELTSNPLRVAANHLYQSMGFEMVKTNCYKMDLD